jgi:hypothetical protein
MSKRHERAARAAQKSLALQKGRERRAAAKREAKDVEQRARARRTQEALPQTEGQPSGS